MSDILELAHSIETTKNEIKEVIRSRGVEVSDTEKFSVYPSKIDMIGRIPGSGTYTDNGTEILLVKNATGSAVKKGQKVFLNAPLGTSYNTVTKLESTSGGSYIPSRDGSCAYAAAKKKLYYLDGSSVSNSNVAFTSVNYIKYMDNNSIFNYYSGEFAQIFPNQIFMKYAAIRHNLFWNTETHKVCRLNPVTFDLIKEYEFVGQTRSNTPGAIQLIEDYLIVDFNASYRYLYKLDESNNTITFIAKISYGINASSGVTSDNKYIIHTGGRNIYELDKVNNDLKVVSYEKLKDMNSEILNKYIADTNISCHWSFNEYTGNLMINNYTERKIVVFHYNNDKFEKILEQEDSDISSSGECVLLSDDLKLVGLKSGLFYLRDGKAYSYNAVLPTASGYSENVITGIANEDAEVDEEFKVSIVAFPRTEASVSVDINDAIITDLSGNSL